MKAKRNATVGVGVPNLVAAPARARAWRNRMLGLLVVAVGCLACDPQVATAQMTANVMVNPPSHGTVSPSPGYHMYTKGTKVSIKATPDSCYRFVRWQATCGTIADNDSASTTLTVWNDGTLYAEFEFISYCVEFNTPNHGTVSPVPGWHCYACGSGPISIKATPAPGYVFDWWSSSSTVKVASPTSASTTMTVTGDGSISAIFKHAPYKVTVCTPVGGTVSPSPGEHSYDQGGMSFIEATPAPCYRFVQWTGSGVSVASLTDRFTTMTVNGNGTLCPQFEKIQYTVTVCTPSNGTVSPSPGDHAYNCGSSGSIEATPAEGYRFKQWVPGGAVSVQLRTAVNTLMTLTGNASLCAEFERTGTEDGGAWFVDAGAKGRNDGSKWADAFSSLQDALAVAKAGDAIWLAQGVYTPDHGKGQTPGDRQASFKLVNGVSILGGFPSGGGTLTQRNPSRYETILSGNIGALGDHRDNSLHVVRALNCDAKTVLDGLTIADGNANGSTTPDDRGGGLFLDPSSPALRDCTFLRNAASLFGGGIYTDYDSQSEPNLIRCTFRENTALRGGALYNDRTCHPALIDCRFVDNSADVGGAIYNSQGHGTLVNCSFTGNSATDNGGALKDDRGTITLVGCTLARQCSRGQRRGRVDA